MAKPFSELTHRGQARRLRPLALEALRSYDLAPRRLRLLGNDWNCMFRVDATSGPTALRVMRRDTAIAANKVRSEDEFVSAMATTTGIHSPAIVPNRAGDPITIAGAAGVPESRACVLFEWLPGRLLAESVTPSRWAALGELAARLHAFASSWRPSTSFEAVTYHTALGYGAPLVLFDRDQVDLFGLDSLLREAYDATNERVAAIMREQRHIVVHGDLHAWNVKVDRGALVPFDWEDLLWATPVLDVATSLFYVRDRVDYLQLARAFRSGYERHLPWVETQPGEIDRLLIARGIDMLNFVALDPALHPDDMEAYVRRRELPARIAVGDAEPVVI